MNPSVPQDLTDITMAFKNLEMTHLTPYTVKFLGYRIDSGKLSVDLKYLIKEQQLKGDNRILLDQLTLGEKMESPDAIDAPLELAIALLQDSDGKIDLGLPVTGDLQDPQFSYGHLIWKAVGNLLTGIVPAPFRALGAALGVKTDKLDTLVFQPGSAALIPPEEEKLYKGLYEELLARQPVSKQALADLALQRGEAILKQLTVRNKLPGAQVKLLKPAAVKAGSPDGVSAKLDLAVAG